MAKQILLRLQKFPQEIDACNGAGLLFSSQWTMLGRLTGILRSGDERITASKHATAGTGEAEPTGDDSAAIGARTATGTSRLRVMTVSAMIAAFSSTTDSAAGASVSCAIAVEGGG
jgi:hypothetical protein